MSFILQRVTPRGLVLTQVSADVLRIGRGTNAELRSDNAAVSLDLRDKPIEPRRGFYIDARVTKGTKFALGDYEYLQATPELRAFMSLGGTTDLGGGCRSMCTPAFDLWLEGGAVTHLVANFSCAGVC